MSISAPGLTADLTGDLATNTTVTWTPAVTQAAGNGIYADLSGTSPVATVVYL